MSEKRIAVIGGGPAGGMVALLLSQRGFDVDVYEKRSDFRVDEAAAADAQSQQFGQSQDAIKRSINLALSHRGQSALSAAGVLDRVMSSAVSMPCRAIHPVQGGVLTQPYGKPGQAISSISRWTVNKVLLDACEAAGKAQAGQGRVTLHFCCNVTYDAGTGALHVTLADGREERSSPALVVGADGAYSKVRDAMLRVSRADFSRRFIAHGYKELTMPASPSGQYVLPHPNALHIWPRVDFMLIALPNPDKSFTCTLFAPFPTLDALDADPSTVPAFFTTHFPDALPFLDSLEAQFRANPTSSLVETRLSPYTWKGRLALVGDAAHATVPFYGQGMNAALEDCLVLAECIDACAGNLARAVTTYGERRQPAGIALCDLSMGNYDEMKAKTGSWAFRARKRLEAVLHALFPSDWIPQYTMVAFTRIPYHEVVQRERRQDAMLEVAVGAAGVAAVVGAALLGMHMLHRQRVPIPVLALKWM